MIKLAKKINSDSDKKTNKQIVVRNLLVILAVAAVAVTAIVSSINMKKVAAYKEEANKISSEIEGLKADTDAIQKLIDGKGLDEYCEKIAREKYGYSKPGERVIYNSSNEK